MNLDQFVQYYLPLIENDLLESLSIAKGTLYNQYYEMLSYHLGFSNNDPNHKSSGKRIRPILLLLADSSLGGDISKALPAATAIELIHNFSLIHDDIEDNSVIRRGQKTVWKKWGIPQAINAGDAMYALATLSLMRMNKLVPTSTILEATDILHQTCLKLTQGQYLDISFETREEITIDDYINMISGKTAALISASCEIGALIAQSDTPTRNAYKSYGVNLGLAFQIQDDILGIWGNQESIGKSNMSDLISKKKTLPIIFGIQNIPEFNVLWNKNIISLQDANELAKLLDINGAKAYAENQTKRYTQLAIQNLKDANQKPNEEKLALFELTNRLLNRDY